MTILGPKTGIATLAAARMQQWALILSAYSYTIEYRKASENANADALSRLPVEVAEPDVDNETFMCSFLEDILIRAKDIKEATKVDPVLSQVFKYILEGWPKSLNQSQSNLKQFFYQKDHLSVEQGCILLGYRVIVPTKYQERLLSELHSDHPGMCKMKALACSYLWWPSLNKDIEMKVKSCKICRSVATECTSTCSITTLAVSITNLAKITY